MAHHRDPVSANSRPKVKNYCSNGTGRDTYIAKFNGGYMADNLIQQIKPQPQCNHIKMQYLTASNKNLTRANNLNLPPQIPPKTARYWGDGSGRDYFVISNDGGQCAPYRWQDNADIKFASALRQYPQTGPLRPTTASTRYDKLAEPKQQARVLHRPHTPNIKNPNYQSYQTLKYQSKAIDTKEMSNLQWRYQTAQ